MRDDRDFFVQGPQHAPAMIEPFLNLQAPVRTHERRHSATEPIIEVSTSLPANLQHVPKPLRRDERRARPLSFEQRVGGHGRAMHDGMAGDRGQPPQPFQDRLCRIRGSREHLEGLHATVASRSYTAKAVKVPPISTCRLNRRITLR